MKNSILFLLVFSSLASAAPVVNYRGILNAASYSLPGLPNSSIARGSIFSIFGTGLGPSGLTQQDSFPLKTTLANVSIEVRQGNTRVAAIPIAITAGQINAIMPSNAPLGNVSIQVTFNGSASNYSTASVVAASFGIFSVNSAGTGPGIVQNVNSEVDRPINSLKKPARRGQPIILWGTGLGPVANDAAVPTAGDLPTQVEVFVGGKVAPTLYKGRSPCCSGLDQIVVNVPSDAPLGCYVPVQVRIGGSVVSNSVTMALSDTATCTDPQNPASSFLTSTGTSGLAVLGRVSYREDIGLATPRDFVDDQFAAVFQRNPGNEFAFNLLLSLPPVGTCTTLSRTGGVAAPSTVSLSAGTAALLDAGPSIRVQATTVPRFPGSNLYYSELGSSDKTMQPTLSPGTNLTLSATGGADIGAFSLTVSAPPSFDFTNRNNLNSVPRTQPLTVSWPSSNGTVLIVGMNFDHPNNASGVFTCTASASAGTFSVPTYVLQTIPASRPVSAQSNGYVLVGIVPSTTGTLSAPNLDRGVALGVSVSGKSVVFR